MTDRSTCWSITINNPTDADLKPSFPNNKWILTGQIEKGENDTPHYQGMLTTPQVRFSAVKKVLPRAHIEVARNKSALNKYVHKDDTRLAEVQDIRNNIPTLFDYQHTIASKWNMDDFQHLSNQLHNVSHADCILEYVDTLVEKDIRNGVLGVEYIAINPMWRSSWKKFGMAIVARQQKIISELPVENGQDNEEGSNLEEESSWDASSQISGSQELDRIPETNETLP